ncbi:hypothetical protein GCM10023224_27990 [Streptomonospora halophila]|uniref:Ribosomal RNA large subunit methyltransferase K/L-like methyltransferase domain-containing protein n=1 Tax=Streptomonospora halophila TaxID=427369 RepID=A0ABP9GH75_9ACTN
MPSARPGAAESLARALSLSASPRTLVRTVTGLEHLAARELAEAGHRVVGSSKRQLVVEPTAATAITDPPRLADDLFLVAAAVADPGRTRPGLASAAAEARSLLIPPSWARAAEGCAVTASFHGRRNYTRFDIEDAVGAALRERTGAAYHSRRAGTAPPADSVEWRVLLDGTTMWIGVRPFDAPLHRRSWRRETVVGSLHPPVAAAVARLARIKPGHRVADTFCGAGTLLLEGRELAPGAEYLGVHRDPRAIAAARANTPRPGAVRWRVGDARHFAESHARVDRIVTNPPWDVRLGIGDLAPYARRWRRALRPGGLVAAIVSRDQSAALAEDPRWHVLHVHEVSLAGRHPRIVVLQPAP